MMYYNRGWDINQLMRQAAGMLDEHGITEDSRNGPVIRLPEPLITEWKNPNNRVLFSPTRDANPFFHLMEALWMLAGRNDVAFVAQFNSRIAEFSDNGITFHAPYGYRWRNHFDIDQLKECVELLRSNPSDRRVVLAMWDPNDDLAKTGKDFPCNTHIYFSTMQGRLDMTVCNRSNDILWGLYGANAVHMSLMMEFVATATGLELGTMYTLSNNAHFYPENFKYSLEDIKGEELEWCHGEEPPLFINKDVYHLFLGDCEDLCNTNTVWAPRTVFFRDTVANMKIAWDLHKTHKNTKSAIQVAKEIASPNWRRACVEWLERRKK